MAKKITGKKEPINCNVNGQKRPQDWTLFAKEIQKYW